MFIVIGEEHDRQHDSALARDGFGSSVCCWLVLGSKHIMKTMLLLAGHSSIYLHSCKQDFYLLVGWMIISWNEAEKKTNPNNTTTKECFEVKEGGNIIFEKK